MDALGLESVEEALHWGVVSAVALARLMERVIPERVRAKR